MGESNREIAASFADAIAQAPDMLVTFVAGDGHPGTRMATRDEIAAAVLAMPEMRAIAQHIAADVWLRSTVRACASTPIADDRADPIIFMGVDGDEYVVPRHVIEWALSVAGEPR